MASKRSTKFYKSNFESWKNSANECNNTHQVSESGGANPLQLFIIQKVVGPKRYRKQLQSFLHSHWIADKGPNSFLNLRIESAKIGMEFFIHIQIPSIIRILSDKENTMDSVRDSLNQEFRMPVAHGDPTTHEMFRGVMNRFNNEQW
jgi:hypothetical protein